MHAKTSCSMRQACRSPVNALTETRGGGIKVARESDLIALTALVNRETSKTVEPTAEATEELDEPTQVTSSRHTRSPAAQVTSSHRGRR